MRHPQAFDTQPTLEGERLRLRPLTNADREDLYRAASDPRIWAQHPNHDRWQRTQFDPYFDDAIKEGALAVEDKATNRIIGTTRFYDYDSAASQVAIGWTFIETSYWGGSYNAEMKRLMLAHAFKTVDRVILEIGKDNQRSRKAATKIGARYLGEAKQDKPDHVVYALDRSTYEITYPTLSHYDTHAERFWEGTKDHDVTQNIDAMLRHIEGDPPYRILDFGCGPGRDLKTLKDRGHEPIGLDGSVELARMARQHSGCEVWRQHFLALDLPQAHFDAVFANASLFHVPTKDLPKVLTDLHATLKPNGILFSSNPRGDDQEGWNQDRYGAYHSLDSWRRYLEQVGFQELEHYYRPQGLPRDQQNWLATVWRKGPIE